MIFVPVIRGRLERPLLLGRRCGFSRHVLVYLLSIIDCLNEAWQIYFDDAWEK